jgi:hypothetical protein
MTSHYILYAPDSLETQYSKETRALNENGESHLDVEPTRQDKKGTQAADVVSS